jgi:hypothetical protein
VSAHDGRVRRKRRRRGDAPLEPDGATPPSPDQGWVELQHRAGNRGVGAVLRRAREEGNPTDPTSILARLGNGRPLDGPARTRMEGVTGRDLSDVRIHTEGSDARLAEDLGSRAFTVGDHVAFAPGEFRPGTPVGDAVLAHELAHVEQQEGGEEVASSTTTAAAEHDADRATVGTMAGLWAQGTTLARNLTGGARPRLRTGLSLHRCIGGSGIEKREPPRYLGPHSREALEDIRHIERSLDIVSGLIMFGTVTGAASPEGAVGEAVGVGVSGESTLVQGMPNALLDVYVIKGYRILERIDFLRLEHGNELNEQERQFWDRAYDRVSELKSEATRKRRGGK